jgi:hypothetical protein
MNVRNRRYRSVRVCALCVCVCVCARARAYKHQLFAAHISEGNITFVAIQTPQCHKLFQRKLQFAYMSVDAKT